MATQYELSRSYWDFAFENTDKVSPIHAAIFLFAVEHCNRMGWKQKFGLPTSMVLEAIGTKTYNTYKKHFDDLVDWGFFIVHKKAKNQYSANVIALSTALSKNYKALDKALIKHSTKQNESTLQSTGSIDKPITIDNRQYNKDFVPPTVDQVKEYFKEKGYREDVAQKAFDYYDAAKWTDSEGKKVKSWKQKMIGVWFKDENKIVAASATSQSKMVF
jgi:hypothetical protein